MKMLEEENAQLRERLMLGNINKQVQGTPGSERTQQTVAEMGDDYALSSPGTIIEHELEDLGDDENEDVNLAKLASEFFEGTGLRDDSSGSGQLNASAPAFTPSSSALSPESEGVDPKLPIWH